jgi:hypothetical protein
MGKFEILKAVVDFAHSCEVNGVQLFYRYAPHVNMVEVFVYECGKYSENGTIEYSEEIYFDDPNPFEQLEKIIHTIIDKYYVVK